jgi:hypothetical protein
MLTAYGLDDQIGLLWWLGEGLRPAFIRSLSNILPSVPMADPC